MDILNKFAERRLSTIECDTIALERVNPKLLRKESTLAKTAWFDYRLLHPTQRSYLFAHYYEQAFRFMIRLHVDYEQVEGDNPRSFLPKRDLLGKSVAVLRRERKSGVISAFRNTTALWKARQKADELGIPYGEFCMSGMKAAIGRIWQRTPTPAQLYSQNIINAIIDRWAELITHKIYASSLDFYTLDNWIAHPSQLEHARWLCEQIRMRTNPEFALADYAFRRRMIPVQELRANFSEQIIIAASKISKSLL